MKEKENGCERNFKGRFSKELPWRVVQQFFFFLIFVRGLVRPPGLVYIFYAIGILIKIPFLAYFFYFFFISYLTSLAYL